MPAAPRGSHQRRRPFSPRYVPTERRRSRHLTVLILAWFAFFLFLRHFVIATGFVTGLSMVPTIAPESTYFINRYVYRFHAPQRGDIVILRSSAYATEELLKRIIGLPGELLEIRQGVVHINGAPLDEAYVRYRYPQNVPPYRLGKDTYFVMGDNRQLSIDSRDFGAVTRANIDGKVEPGRVFAWW